MIPEFRDDGYLPEGIHIASEFDVLARFGEVSTQRKRLAVRLKRWLGLARSTNAQRFFIDGSFITSKPNPNDIDAVILLSEDFRDQVNRGLQDALELESLLVTREPDDLFAAEDSRDWNQWVEFFSMTRESGDIKKGLVEIKL